VCSNQIIINIYWHICGIGKENISGQDPTKQTGRKQELIARKEASVPFAEARLAKEKSERACYQTETMKEHGLTGCHDNVEWENEIHP